MPGVEAEFSTAVLDASVAVRWVVPERGSEEAAELLVEAIGWVAPRLLLVESAAALRRKIVAGELAAEQGLQALEALLQAVADGVVRLADDEEIVPSAVTLALTLAHKVPDCVYLALAEREGLGLVTADRRLHELARRRGVASHLIPAV